jgi:glutamate/tyrosine decarboxylase-like PLP-dependent enzyme
VLVCDAAAMRAAFSLVPPYLRTEASMTGVGGPPWFSEYGFQQTRGFRALKVWMTMKHLGLDGYKAAIEENLALAGYLVDGVRSAADLELMAPPSLSVVCFSFVDRSRPDEERLTSLNRALLERLQLGGEAFLTSTELRGRFVLRACIVNYRSVREDIDRMPSPPRRIAQSLPRPRRDPSRPL